MRPASPLTLAAETRRRELPASIALVILAGGVAAAIVGGPGTIAWAAIMSLLLIADCELYRRLDGVGVELDRHFVGLAAWAFLGSAFFSVLPIMLWIQGGAGAAAAIVLWVAASLRHFGASNGLPLALAGAAPPAAALLITPLASALASPRADWDIAVIAVLGGSALLAYAAQGRLRLNQAERALRKAAGEVAVRRAFTSLMFEPCPSISAAEDFAPVAAKIAKPDFGATYLQQKTG